MPEEDLPELLSLQIDVEHLAAMPEERPRHDNLVLKEQVRTLENERNALAAPLLQELDLNMAPNSRCVGLIDVELTRRIAAVRTLKKQHGDAPSALDDPQRRRHLLGRRAAEQGEYDQEAASAAFDISFDEIDTAPPRTRKRRRQ